MRAFQQKLENVICFSPSVHRYPFECGGMQQLKCSRGESAVVGEGVRTMWRAEMLVRGQTEACKRRRNLRRKAGKPQEEEAEESMRTGCPRKEADIRRLRGVLV